MKKLMYIVLVLLLLSSWVQNSVDCKKLISDYYTKMYVTKLPKGKSAYYMKYKTETVFPLSSGYPIAKSTVSILLTEEQYHYLSEQVDMYKDKQDVFVIMKQEKKIYWSLASQNENTTAAMVNQVYQIRDSVLQSAVVLKCADVDKDAQKLKKVELQTSDRIAKATNISKLNYWLDTKAGTIIQSELLYKPGYKHQSTIVTYEKIDFNYKLPSATIKVKSILLNDKNQLQSKYKGYELIDIRNEK